MHFVYWNIFTVKRCGIPVIIMGETGCGKTRLIRFMCELQAGLDGPKNLLLMKVCLPLCTSFLKILIRLIVMSIVLLR